MAVTTYSYAQIVAGFSGYFDITSDPAKRCMQANSVLFLSVTGTDASIKCGGGGANPFVVTVDGTETNPTMVDGVIPLFSGLADVVHLVSIVPESGYLPVYNWFTVDEPQILSVTGAAPAIVTIPMDYATWSTFGGTSTCWTMDPAGGNITPTEKMVDDDQYGMGVISFLATCDSIFVFSGNSSVKYAIDDGAIQTATVATATTQRHVCTLATGLDDTAEHKYTIWPNTTPVAPQAVACLANGAVVPISPLPITTKTLIQYGDSITQGVAGATGGAVDTFAVGLGTGLAVAKWGHGGLTTSQLTAEIPGYFLKSDVPDYALLAIARNDVFSGTLQADYTACIQALLTAGCTNIICRGILPEGADLWATENTAIQAAITSFANPNIVFMDTSTWSGIATADGVHPTAAGYVTIAAYEVPALLDIITPSYLLTIDANGATSGTPPAATAHPAGTISLPENMGNLAKTGYTLNGWNTLANGTGTHYTIGGSYIMPANAVTLYAEWLIDPPANTVAPTITGPAVVGQQITGSNGTWTNSPSSYIYQWQSLDGTWSNIAGAESIAYAPVSGDVGFVLRLAVTAVNAGGSISQASYQSSTISAVGTAGGEHGGGYFG